MGAISTALFGDYTRTFWSVLAITGLGIAFAVISYCLWCCTHALAICCLHCRICRRRAPSQAEPDLTDPPEETPPLRGPHGLQPTDNDFYASIKNISRKRGGRPHVLVAAGAHTARLAQPEGGATPRANAHGVVLEFTDVISASSRRARNQLETASTSRVHLCREHPCRAEVDVALHATAYAPIDRDHPLDLRGESNSTVRRCRWSATSLLHCVAWTFRQTSLAGYRTGRGVSRLSNWLCCCRRRSPTDGSTPGEWKESLSESESEPEDTRCQAHLVLCVGATGDATSFASKRCWDRALPAAARLIEEDACASGLGLTGSEPGTARLCHCHTKTYELDRVKLKCAYQACYQLGTVHTQGLTLCGEHARAHRRAEPGSQHGSGRHPTQPIAPLGGAVTPPDPDNPLPVDPGVEEGINELTSFGGADSHPERRTDSTRPPLAPGATGVHALVRGTNSTGQPAYFRFHAKPGRTGSPAGWASVHIPTLDWDLTVPQELYGLDPQEGDLTHSLQGTPVIVARGTFAGPEGLDDRGRSLSAQALSLIRAAVKHGSVQHAFCRSPPTSPDVILPEEYHAAPDLQSQLKATSPRDETLLTREALRRLITVEASRRMPEGPALVRAFLEAVGPGVPPTAAAEALHDEYGADDMPTVTGMIAQALRTYRSTGDLDSSEVAALMRVEQELTGPSRQVRAESNRPRASQSPPSATRVPTEDPTHHRQASGDPPVPRQQTPYADPDVARTLWSRLNLGPQAQVGVPAGAILGGFSANPTAYSPQVRREGCPSLSAYMTGPVPTVRFAGIPADDTRHSGAGPVDDSRQVQVLADIAYGISQQNRAAEEGRHESRGTPSSLTRADEFAVLTARGLDRFEVALCPGEWGRGLYRAIKKTAESSSALFRHLKWPTPISNRMAFAISAFSWGGRGVAHVPLHALSAADFPTVRAEAFDEHVVPADTKLEARPRAPTVYLQWVRQAENMAHAFALVYGHEYREPITRFLRHLQHLHEGNDHQYPFSFIADAWEEVFWRETEEIRHAVASLLKTMGKETSRKEDFVAAALVARSDGSGPALRLPTVWDYEDPQGYFASVILQRLHERAMRVWWDHTHKAGLARPTRKQGEETSKSGDGPTSSSAPATAKAGESANTPTPGTQLKGYPAGKVLSQAEVGLSRQHAPLDAQGKMKCWDASSHMGCKMTASQCSRSHEILRTKGIHWTVQAQLLRRGGVRTGPVVPPNQVDAKVAALRQAANRESASHRQPQKAGEDSSKAGPESVAKPSSSAPSTQAGATPEQTSSNAAHVGASAPTWSPPAEYLSFDCTPMEETLRQWLLGPDPTWRQDHHSGPNYAQGAEPTDPLVKVRQEALDAVAASTEGQAVAASPDRLRAYVHTRLAEARLGHQALTLEDVLKDASDLGDEELSAMAETVLDQLGVPGPTTDRKAGSAPVEIGYTDWSRGFPGVAMVSWHGEEWRALDYGDKLPMSHELCEQIRKPAGTMETRQCLLKSVAAAVLHAQDGQVPAHGQVLISAQALRTAHWWSATEAAVALGDCPQWISSEENDLRMFIHDVIESDHEKDFHSLAAFPHESHGDLALYVWRVSRGGALTLESLVGADFQTNTSRPKVAHALVHKGHMRLLVPPKTYTHRQWLQQVAAHHAPPLETPCFGWGSIMLQSASSVPTTPGDVLAKCQRCKANSAALTGDTRVGRMAEDAKWRTLSTWGLKAWDALPAKSSSAPRAQLDLTGRDAKCIEIFAGTARVTQSWLETGALADDPIELYTDPLSRKGPRPEHDILRTEVQRALLNKAKSPTTARPTHWFIEFPCGSFCDWQIHNGGTRTFQDPVGHPDGPQWEQDGTKLATFAASLYGTVADAGDVAVAENPAPSGRYPSAFDLPCWQRVLRRRDTLVIPMDLCEHGCGPIDAPDQRHRKRTWIVTNDPALSALARRCSQDHVHAPLRGTRPGARFSRCTEAGEYTWQFAHAIADTCAASARSLGARFAHRARPAHERAGAMKGGGRRCKKQRHNQSEATTLRGTGGQGGRIS